MMLRLDPAIPLWTPKGNGLAHFVTDYGVETNLIWTVFLESGEIWSFQNPEVRAVENETLGRHRETLDDLPTRWKNFPDEWPDEDMDYCLIRIQSDPQRDFIAKLDCPMGTTRGKMIIFSLKNKKFIYEKDHPSAIGFDQVTHWKRVV